MLQEAIIKMNMKSRHITSEMLQKALINIRKQSCMKNIREYKFKVKENLTYIEPIQSFYYQNQHPKLYKQETEEHSSIDMIPNAPPFPKNVHFIPKAPRFPKNIGFIP
eukprot:Pgem_evm1s9222